MKLGGNTKDTPTAWWERAAEEADVATEDPQEGREREIEGWQMSLYLSLWKVCFIFCIRWEETEVLPAFFDRITIFKAQSTQGWSKCPRISSKLALFAL